MRVFSYQFIEGACGGSSFVFERLVVCVPAVARFDFIVLAAAALIYKFSGRNTVRAAVLICTLTFAGVCVGSSALSRAATVITVADVGNGSAVVVSSGGKTVLLGCGGDSYYALSNIESAIDSVGADNLDFLLIPRVSEGESSLALDVIDTFRPSIFLQARLMPTSMKYLNRKL